MHRRVTVVECECVCVWFDFAYGSESSKKSYGLPESCNRLIWNVFFRKTASSQRYRILVKAILVHQSASLLALAGARAYIYSSDVALDHVVLVTGFAIVFGAYMGYSALVYLRHWTLASTTWHHSSEGRYLQCNNNCYHYHMQYFLLTTTFKYRLIYLLRK